MTIVLCGGGTAGHITPLLAVARELRRINPSVHLVYIGERNGKFAQIVARGNLFDEIKLIPAGKFRRYHGQSLLACIIDIKTLLFNIWDFFKFLAGISLSIWLIGRLKPQAIFLKGGFVSVPVACAARIYKVPYITHDSDILPGLANRLSARWARYHATALGSEYYPYPKESVREVGVPVDEKFQSVTMRDQQAAKKSIGMMPADPVLFITGGSSGARRLNKTVVQILPQILQKFPKLQVLHQIGAGNEDQYNDFSEAHKKRVKYFGVTASQHLYSAAADVIITRAGATAITEFAVQGKACIIVPNPFLTGGHQLKNAETFEQIGAAVVVQESDIKSNPDVLYKATVDLLNNPKKRNELAGKLQATQAGKKAAHDIAKLIVEVAR
jgi:UDP-N-acetylglucosamine--N-acetylmuramyl-(pentapeptide) pyrophosphoryl-undecaprenol N-acetylglucosamine transferase